MRITVLGSGHSGGTPLIGVGWAACDPENPRNRRLRPSIMVEDGGQRLLVDTSPDLRQQLLRAEVSTLDGLLYTHGHADHLHGIDDLRAINNAINGFLPTYADAETWRVIGERFGYVMEPLAADATFYYKPCLNAHTIGPGQTFDAAGIRVTAFAQDHGYTDSLGFRFGPVAYSSDVLELPEESFAILDGVEVWLVDVLTDKPHPTHAHLDKALEWIERVGPKLAILTHLSHHLDYADLVRRLPDGVQPAYDGMRIEVGNGRGITLESSLGI